MACLPRLFTWAKVQWLSGVRRGGLVLVDETRPLGVNEMEINYIKSRQSRRWNVFSSSFSCSLVLKRIKSKVEGTEKHPICILFTEYVTAGKELGWGGRTPILPSWLSSSEAEAAGAPDCLKFQLDVGLSGRPLCDTNPQSFRCHSALAPPFVKGPLNQIDTIYSISLFIHMYAAPRFDKRLLSRGKITTWHFKARSHADALSAARTLNNNKFSNNKIRNKKIMLFYSLVEGRRVWGPAL